MGAGGHLEWVQFARMNANNVNEGKADMQLRELDPALAEILELEMARLAGRFGSTDCKDHAHLENAKQIVNIIKKHHPQLVFEEGTSPEAD